MGLRPARCQYLGSASGLVVLAVQSPESLQGNGLAGQGPWFDNHLYGPLQRASPACSPRFSGAAGLPRSPPPNAFHRSGPADCAHGGLDVWVFTRQVDALVAAPEWERAIPKSAVSRRCLQTIELGASPSR